MSPKRKSLPVIVDCQGCGVCCLHMGYPAFMRPQPSRTAEEIQADPELSELAKNDAMRELLEKGHPGEVYWHRLPDGLKEALDGYIDQNPDSSEGLDGPCIWFDMETRRCKHHEFRPRVCRDFEIGSSRCREWRNHYREMIAVR